MDIKPIEGWLTAPEAADVLGVSKQAVHAMVAGGKFDMDEDVRGAGDKPVILIREAAVHQLCAKRLEPRVSEDRRLAGPVSDMTLELLSA